jgi:hypothetical protein
MARPNRPVAGQRIEKAEWVSQAVRLAIKGWSYRRIGEKVGRSQQTVAEALTKEFERTRPSVEELEAAREVMREKFLRREGKLNELIRAHWASAKGGDMDAAKVVLDADKGLDRVHASLCRLDGLDAPKRTEVSGPSGEPIPFGLGNLSDEQLDRVLAALPASGADPGGAADGSEGGEGAEAEGPAGA